MSIFLLTFVTSKSRRPTVAVSAADCTALSRPQDTETTIYMNRYFTKMTQWAACAAVWCCMALLPAQAAKILTGDQRTDLYLPLLQGKTVAVFSNHTGLAGKQHIVDLLLAHKVQVKAIFAPEHGFRGKADAGEHVDNEVDSQTGLPVISLYGGRNKNLADLVRPYDVLIVDIQDVGLRFYTYYVTMLKLMEACAETGRTMIIMDRPNPNGFYVDGPILDMKYKSGVGGLPIPVVHGMTLAELGLMINGEHWLKNGRQCPLTVIPCKNYTHQSRYKLPVKPSPNLPNMKSVYLYPSTCYFEATPVSLGRGTDMPFQVYGHPDMKQFSFRFMPQSVEGAKNPPQLNKWCYGRDLRHVPDKVIWRNGINLEYLIEAYRAMNIGDGFFRSFMELLIGVDYVRKMIEEGRSAQEIKACWKQDVEQFLVQRRPYLLYDE